MKKNYKQVTESANLDMLEGPLEEAIESMKDLQAELVDAGWENINSKIDIWDEWAEWTITGECPMTNKEMEVIKKKRKRERERRAVLKEANERAEREQYERLKAKFEQEA